ncbi:DUF6950 family protein [Pelagibacterium lentulum]|uniref:DUF6950 domain-containing protein n=1 Tax=Pelagibacterium lentulum TaxID=2029865 RepID=A0A916RPJ9_9HYPH|nr:hypothetical protein [Pelagibacterium lentulum]GGA65013.1 hypothetical protein GCM10011499_39340 [Pelagibacterium lentulum]
MRKHDWRKRLGQYVDNVRTKPYAFGYQDCWLFVAGAVSAMTGTNHAKKHKGKYKTARGALGIMRRAGANNMADFAGLYLEEHSAPVFAHIGDVMAIPTDDAFGFSLGILNGERVLVVTPNGIDTRDRSEATRAFKV